MGRGRPNKTAQTRTWLKSLLANGSKPAEEVALAARQLGISPRTLNTTKRILGVESIRRGGGFHWRDPDVMDSAGGSPDLVSAILELTKAVKLLARHSASGPAPDALPLPIAPLSVEEEEQNEQFDATWEAALARQRTLDNVLAAKDPFAILQGATALEIGRMESTVKGRKFSLEQKRETITEKRTAEFYREEIETRVLGKGQKFKDVVLQPNERHAEETPATKEAMEKRREYFVAVKTKVVSETDEVVGYKPLPPEEAAEIEKWNKWLKEASAKIAQLTSGQ